MKVLSKRMTIGLTERELKAIKTTYEVVTDIIAGMEDNGIDTEMCAFEEICELIFHYYGSNYPVIYDDTVEFVETKGE